MAADYLGKTMLATMVEMDAAHKFDEICLRYGLSINEALAAYIYNCVKTDSLTRESGGDKRCCPKTQ